MKSIFAVMRKEIKEAFRDRRTLIMSVLLPAVLVPAIVLGIFYFEGQSVKQETKSGYTVAFQGSEELRSFLANANLKVIDSKDVSDMVLQKKADVGVVEEQTSSHSQITVVTSFASGSKGENAASYVNGILPSYRELRIKQYLATKGIKDDVFSLVVVQSKQVGEPNAFLKFMLAYIVSLVMLSSGFVGNVYLGTDIGAGEKERGTLESLLATPVSRFHIAMGKWLALAVLNSIGTLITLLSFTFSYTYALTNFDLGLGVTAGTSALSIWGSGIWAMVIGAILLSLTGAALQFIISIYSRNMREAQLYLGQMGMVILPFIFVLIPSLTNATAMPTWLYFVPIVNASAVTYNVIIGNVVWPLIGMAFLIDVVVAIILALVVSKFMNKESVILRI
ncbi:ABC transporter permease subunit [Coprothermobacter platensis]|uniref:ABC transporter permease subunit n=1 Tax=Coprothermobacter platensis TaxID=108819 RepID=UPI0003828032|nr:ABC transporter permease subunit [Coprothermobacter platensis]